MLRIPCEMSALPGIPGKADILYHGLAGLSTSFGKRQTSEVFKTSEVCPSSRLECLVIDQILVRGQSDTGTF
jgi:hypothetical protein